MRGMHFREDDPIGESLMVKIDDIELEDQVVFRDEYLIYIRPPNVYTEGPQHIWIS